MTSSEMYGRDTVIDVLLSVARRETLMLAAATCAIDDDATAIASARLRWAIGSARQLIVALGDDAQLEANAQHADRLDRIANRAQRWLVAEPPRPLQEIGWLVDRTSARRGRHAPAVNADHATLVELDLDDLELTRISLRGARLVEVTLRRATCTAADASESRWRGCELAGAALAMAVLAGARLDDCDLSRANLAGTSWHRATLTHCALRDAALRDARLDRAVFSDCDLRGANLAIARSPHVATLAGARFVRCDLRDTDWRGRELAGAMFVDCAVLGARGGPAPG